MWKHLRNNSTLPVRYSPEHLDKNNTLSRSTERKNLYPQWFWHDVIYFGFLTHILMTTEQFKILYTQFIKQGCAFWSPGIFLFPIETMGVLVWLLARWLFINLRPLLYLFVKFLPCKVRFHLSCGVPWGFNFS